MNKFEDARNCFEKAINFGTVRDERTIWLLAAEFEQRQEAYTRARTILQKARVKFAQNDQIWHASIKLELSSENQQIAAHLLARALQECPTSGILWALAIEIEPVSTRMRKSTDALKSANEECVVFVAIGKIFWSELKVEKARRFFKRATELDPDNGDAWAYLIKFEESCENSAEQIEMAQKDFLKAEPRHGTLWM